MLTDKEKLDRIKKYVDIAKVDLFSHRSTLQEAFEYAYQVARATDNPSSVMAAVHVVANSMAIKISNIAAHPENPEETKGE
jgi:hypothetical protein